MCSSRLLFVLLLALVPSASLQRYVVNTSVGRVRGTTRYSRDDRAYHRWLGIPYAVPPIGWLRFEPPVPSLRKTGILDASNFASKCSQIEPVFNRFVGSEDCLYLNVFTPKPPLAAQTQLNRTATLLPVMYFIHGGYFIGGSSEDFDPSYMMDEDVIVVTFNYRLGVLGFLNTGDGVVRGNMGMKDQALALKWVYENIKNFGGDPEKITVFGGSAGGVSAHMLMLSPLSQRYIYRGISQSGTAFSHWGLYERPKEQAEWLAGTVGCLRNNTKAMTTCLKVKEAEELYTFWAGQSLFSQGEGQLLKINIFTPTVEVANTSDAFLAELPQEIVKRGAFAKVPWIVGTNSAEGLVWTSRYYQNQERLKKMLDEWDVGILLTLDDQQVCHSKPIKDFFFPGLPNAKSARTFLTLRDMLTDRNFLFDQHEALVAHSEYAPAYPYLYNVKTEFSYFHILQMLKGKLPVGVEVAVGMAKQWFERQVLRRPQAFLGSCHGDEMILITPTRFSKVEVGHQDYKMSKDFVRLWTHFAAGQDELTFRNLSFPLYAGEGFQYFQFAYGVKLGMTELAFKDRFDFWKLWNENIGVKKFRNGSVFHVMEF